MKIPCPAAVRTPVKPVPLTILLCGAVWALSCGAPKQLFQANKPAGTLLAAVVLAAALVWRRCLRKERLTQEQITALLLLAGLLVRVVYIWSTPYDVSAHDLGEIVQDGGVVTSGHLGYVGYLLHHGALPQFDPRSRVGFYNPPFYYIVSAAWLRLNLRLGLAWQTAVENLRILTLLYASLCAAVADGIFERFEIRGKIRLALLTLVTFSPPLIWLSGALTSDSLVLLFMLLTVKYSVVWYQERRPGRIVLLALAIGLGMMTKLNCALLAPGAAFLFLLALIQSVKGKDGAVGKLLGQFLLFGLICVPLGLFWPIRCKLLYRIPFNYIERLVEPSGQFLGNAAVWERLWISSRWQLVYAQVQIRPSLDKNIGLTLFRTALFDERGAMGFASMGWEIAGVVLLYATMLLAAVMTVCYVRALCRKGGALRPAYKGYTAILSALILGAYLKFCFAYPHICSMNFRYIAVLPIIPCIGAGLFVKDAKNPEGWTKGLTAAIFFVSALSVSLYLRYCILL